ncbi:hypothetical protein LINGRAHAP2_LOCUS12375 [Linum grandiflorum]
MIAALFLASPARSAEETAKPATHTKFVFKTVEVFVCSKYDPSATLETASSDPSIKDLCGSTDDPKKCLDFLGNTPEADPAYIMQDDLKVLNTLIKQGSALASKEGGSAGTPDVKKGFDTCIENYDKASKSVGEAERACAECVKGDDKGKKVCPKDKVTKVASMLSAAVASFGFCDEALGGASSGSNNAWLLKDMNGAMLDATNMLLVVSKQLDK